MRAPSRALVAALLEPLVAVSVYLLLREGIAGAIGRPDLLLCVLVLALTVPGRDRFADTPLAAAVGIGVSWCGLLALLLLCGWLSSSFGDFDRRVSMAWALLTPFAQWAAVQAARRVLRALALRPDRRRSAVVIGAGPLGVRVADALNDNPVGGTDVVGYFDDRTDQRVHGEAAPHRLGALRDAAAYVREHPIGEVYITLPTGSQPRTVELLEQLHDQEVEVYFVPDVFGTGPVQGEPALIAGLPMVGVRAAPFGGFGGLVKRLTDVVLATLVLLLASPAWLLAVAALRWRSPGPVLQRQRCLGPRGEEIVLYAFRTAQDPGAGASVGASHGAVDGLERQRAMDRLPRFVNVLQGRLSLVGPAPRAADPQDPWRRLVRPFMVHPRVRAGITGWAQVHGQRDDARTAAALQARVAYDLEYLRNWSFGLDVLIIVRALLRLGRGARAT